MNGKTFVSITEDGLFDGKGEDLIINVDHIILVNKKDKDILLSNGSRIYLAEESFTKLESILQPI
jgi:hypothetical protein